MDWAKQPLPLGHGPSKTIQRQLSSGNTIVKTWVGACFMGDSALALGSRSLGLGEMDWLPRSGFNLINAECFVIGRRYKVARPISSSFV